MTPQKGQINQIQKALGFDIVKTDITIVMEFGSDNGDCFLGDFIASVKGSLYRFNEDKTFKKIRA